ncbi:MAG TPA: GreA/GreB family elongation factor [Planctomycetota bacterium]|jgi:transcription elongation factor GreA|nr:GreA/GreB family elongation factor [Planctomycetota bacterium]
MAENWVTSEQYRKLEEQVRAIEEKLADAARKCGEAADHGDLSENAELDAAREEMRFQEARLIDARELLLRSRILTKLPPDDGTVQIGMTVRVRDLDRGKEIVYRIVGGGAFDPDAGEIPYTAPLAAGLVGKTKGIVAEVRVPAGLLRLQILDVRRSA